MNTSCIIYFWPIQSLFTQLLIETSNPKWSRMKAYSFGFHVHHVWHHKCKQKFGLFNMAWSNEQKAFLVQCYIKTKSFKESLRLFCRHFNIDSQALPTKLPSKQIIIYWYKKFLATGSVQSRSKGAQHTKWRRTDEVIQDVLESVVDHRKRSLFAAEV